jgi:hypothetical protein
MNDSIWKYEYEVEHERLLKCQAENKELKQKFNQAVGALRKSTELLGVAYPNSELSETELEKVYTENITVIESITEKPWEVIKDE